MELHKTRSRGEKELNLEWLSGNHRFGIWLDNFNAGWYFVSKVDDMFAGDIDDEVLKDLYEKIGKILESRNV